MILNIQVIWNKLFRTSSTCEKGTLKQLQNLIYRTNLPTKVKDDARAVEEFLNLILDAHIIAAAMHLLGITTKNGTPTRNAFVGDLQEGPERQKQEYLSRFFNTFITKFMSSHVRSIDHTLTSSSTDSTAAAQPQENYQDDGVFNYASSVIGLCLISRNFHDASRKGDGERLMHYWKVFLLHFRCGKRSSNWSFDVNDKIV